jgi:carboxyl-terminal processing protease
MQNRKRISIFLTLIFLFTLSFGNAQASELANQLKGKLLLQVESKGEVWYVNPDDGSRYEVTILNSLPLFRKFALGISTEDLNKIPMLHQSISKDFGLGLKGKFLLDVENKGRIWYVDFNGFRHEVKQENVLSIFQKLSLGISNENLAEIPVGILEEEIIQIEEPETSNSSLESLVNDSDFDNFWELWKMIKGKYAGSEISDADLLEGAKRGLVEALGDDYSIFMNKEESGEFLDELSGQFEGIGAEVSIKNGELTVVAPLPGMPAEKAGILAGDIILEIDGNSTVDMTLNKSVSLIKGEKGTPVILKVKHNDDQEEDITVIRGLVTYASLTHEIREDNIAYIKMIRFNSDASSLFQETVDYLLENDVSGIILDLRNNPGGYLSAAVDVAGYWVGPENIVTEKYKDESKIDEHISRQEAVLGKIPTVVLVNEGSASASEIVAGALQDYGSATIVGEKTFGKGSVQELRPLADGSYIKLTIAKWYTPRGNSIDGEGIFPDISVQNMVVDYNNGIDTQLEKAVKLLK